jgi:L-asparaginase II
MPADADDTLPAHAPIAVTTRGGAVESVHYGSVAVADANGTLVLAAGDPHAITFTRSALKPLQALPFVRDGGPDRFGYTAAQVALLCASHSGEPRHVDGVAAMLAGAGLAVEDLGCGAHAPGYFEARGETPPPPPYSPLAHNCSGKHAGMLACCAMHGWTTGDYLRVDHPVQQSIRAAVAAFCGLPEDALVAGIDGCSAPNYALPLAGLARAFARLAVADRNDSHFGAAPARLRDAMVAHPEMVSGERRSDLALAQAGEGDWIAKIGAEGVQAIGVRSRGLGIAVKVADGSRRALLPAVVAVLDRLGLLDDGQRRRLQPLARPTLHNYRRTVVGQVRPVVVLRPGRAT